MFFLMQTVIRDAIQSRHRRWSEFCSTPLKSEYLPWTSTPGPKGVRTALLNQFKTTNDKVIALAEDANVRVALCTQVIIFESYKYKSSLKSVCLFQMVDLADLVLDGYQTQLEKLVDGSERKKTVKKMFEKDRKDLIMPLGKDIYIYFDSL